MSRKDKAFTEPIFLINMEPVIKNNERIFNILGTSGNKYVVTINNKITCTCMDYKSRNINCKHIYFVVLRICKQTHVSKKLTEKKLIKIFSNIPSFIDKSLTNEKYLIIEKVKQKIDDCCPICLDDLTNEKMELLNYCHYGCGKSFHKKCFILCNNINELKNCAFCRHKLN